MCASRSTIERFRALFVSAMLYSIQGKGYPPAPQVPVAAVALTHSPQGPCWALGEQRTSPSNERECLLGSAHVRSGTQARPVPPRASCSAAGTCRRSVSSTNTARRRRLTPSCMHMAPPCWRTDWCSRLAPTTWRQSGEGRIGRMPRILWTWGRSVAQPFRPHAISSTRASALWPTLRSCWRPLRQQRISRWRPFATWRSTCCAPTTCEQPRASVHGTLATASHCPISPKLRRRWRASSLMTVQRARSGSVCLPSE